ncbi:hypothetical protein PAL_GLEAN10003622 [Pteropus alecto]|uniref:Uncharacterized protein n=1 Tax=Pteropus alecto TaxID=9402 RepID=L5L702_PTEAL|nr:hypothetical protein PAL_GLEAN10003622 [Pteropus alecto]
MWGRLAQRSACAGASFLTGRGLQGDVSGRTVDSSCLLAPGAGQAEVETRPRVTGVPAVGTAGTCVPLGSPLLCAASHGRVFVGPKEGGKRRQQKQRGESKKRKPAAGRR